MGFGFILQTIQEVSVKTGLQQEQLTFLISMTIAFTGAFIFRYLFNSKNVSTTARLLFAGCVGLWLQCFSWGWFASLHFIDITVSYILLKYLPHQYAHKVNFCWCMGFLIICHAYLAYTFHVQMRFSTDFTGPIMMLTQRITSIGFNIHDGIYRREEDLTDHQKKVKVCEFPSYLEYFGYTFCFFGAACGPLVYYSDFIAFMKRDAYKKDENFKEPPYKAAVCRKLFITLVSLCIFFFGSSQFPFDRNAEIEFIEATPWWSRALFLYISLFICRCKYYFAWSLADAIHNIGGMGFTGYDIYGNPKWDLVTNLNILGIEFATNLKMYIDNWNVMTTLWLRSVCYERVPKQFRTMGTFMLSAVWHGLLPGYYITFLSGNLFTYTQRTVRKIVRPSFQESDAARITYDIITWLCTQFAISYIVLSFMLLKAETSLRFFRSCYFCGHIIAISILILLPIMHKQFGSKELPRYEKKHSSSINNEANNNISHSSELQAGKIHQNGLRHR